MFIQFDEAQLRQHLDKVERIRSEGQEDQERPKFEERVLALIKDARDAAGRYDAAAELFRLLENGAQVRRAFELADRLELLA